MTTTLKKAVAAGEKKVGRLSEHTHALAETALRGAWGRSLTELDETLPFDSTRKPDEADYAWAVRRIAEKAPLRVLPGQKIVGAATLRLAAQHKVPMRTADGKAVIDGVSHTTLGFDHALRVGYRGLRKEIETRLARGGLDEQGRRLLSAMNECLTAAGIWHQRHVRLLEERIGAGCGEEQAVYRRTLEALRNVPENPPTNFHEAVQALWFLFCFQRLCGNWPGIGRLDEMLGPYLEKDLAENRLTLDEARELLAHFWINGCDWIGADDKPGSGDAQHYQNIVLAGVDRAGNELVNEATYLVLDVVEELRISDFPIAVRISRRSPEKLLRRVAEVQRLGGGIVAVYNEDLIIQNLVEFGYPREVAREFANDGCWEILIPGRTNFIYRPFDILFLLQQTLGVTDDGDIPAYQDFESLYGAFVVRLRAETAKIGASAARHANSGKPSSAARLMISECIDQGRGNYHDAGKPAALVSLLVRDCIEKGRGYHNRGARYNVLAPHAGGLPDAADSLLVVKKLVFERKVLTLAELVKILRDDWRDREDLRRRIKTEFQFYGNDNAEADAMARRVLGDFVAAAADAPHDPDVLMPPGLSTFGREIEWRKQRKACAAGGGSNDILSANCSPSPGADKNGPTAVIRSHCSLGLHRLPNGTALELKIHPSSVGGENGLRALMGLMRGFVEMGGIFLQIDVVDSELLREAQRCPEKYPNLAVRISGWSARFATLNRQWQDMIIRRTEQR